MATKVMVDGILYPSGLAACQYYNIEYSLFVSRKKRGWTHEQALGVEPPPVKVKRQILPYKGISLGKFKTIREVAHEYGVAHSTARNAIQSSLSFEEVVEKLKKVNSTNKYTGIIIEGVQYDSLSALCKAKGLSIGLFHNYKNSGLTIEEAYNKLKNRLSPLEQFVQDLKEEGFYHLLQGKAYFSIKDICIILDKEYKLVTSRKQCGWSTVEALGLKKKKKPRYFSKLLMDSLRDVENSAFRDILKGKEINILKDFCNLTGVKEMSYRNRKRYGWSTVEALGLVERKGNKNGDKKT